MFRTTYYSFCIALLLLCLSNSVSLLAQTRLGLHVTLEELSVWKQRALNGPYKTRSDVSANSPDDWTRIVNNTNAFKANPAAYRWQGPTLFETSGTFTGAVKKGTGEDVRLSNEPNGNTLGYHIRDAAFVCIVDENRADRAILKATVKAELLHATTIPTLDLKNTTLWPATYFRDINPLFQIVNWFNNYLHAYDYIEISDKLTGEITFTSDEKNRIHTWLLAAAEFAQKEQDWDVNRNFTNRSSSSPDAAYTVAAIQYPVQRNGLNLTTHYTTTGPGHTVYGLMQTFNNRRMACYRFAALVGIKVGNTQLIDAAKRYVKDWIKYSVFTDGVVGEMERWSNTIPDLGWGYATSVAAPALSIADALARTGDLSLYEYSTSIGLYGTEGSNGETKNLYKVMKMMYAIAAKQVLWYGTNMAENASAAYLIDGQTDTWKALHDVWLAMGNLRYKDNNIKAMYMRQGPGITPYWTYPQVNGKHLVWTGDWGIYPGLLFMYGQMEDKVNPYPGTGPQLGTGTIGREYWNTVAGTTVSAIPLNRAPSGTQILTLFEGPVNAGDNYGARIRGYVHAPASGNYIFWIASNDNSELWLSPDESPFSKKKIALVKGGTNSREWTKSNTQKSAKIALQAGKKYYIEVLHKEGTGIDNVAVGWQLPNGILERPIPGMRLSPFLPSPAARIAASDAEEQTVTLPQVYPNPFTDVLYLETVPDNGELLITISDVLGKTYYQQRIQPSKTRTSHDLSLATNGLTPGIYFLLVNDTHGKRKTYRLIKSK